MWIGSRRAPGGDPLPYLCNERTRPWCLVSSTASLWEEKSTKELNKEREGERRNDIPPLFYTLSPSHPHRSICTVPENPTTASNFFSAKLSPPLLSFYQCKSLFVCMCVCMHIYSSLFSSSLSFLPTFDELIN